MGRTMNSQAETLKNNGLKVTLPRLKVLEMFEKTPGQHFSAEDVYTRLIEQGNDIGIATVYRILMQFADAGLLRKSNFDGDKAWFELEDGEHHDHLLCVGCGKVVEFLNPSIETQQRAVAKAHGFELLEHNMVLYGLCGKCKKTQPR
jgi:Fur family transcriptional regulator, ferric uptake regulator